MRQFYQPDSGQDTDSPSARDGANKLVRRSYWLDMDDRTLINLIRLRLSKFDVAVAWPTRIGARVLR
jgi:hypothetical protein